MRARLKELEAHKGAGAGVTTTASVAAVGFGGGGGGLAVSLRCGPRMAAASGGHQGQVVRGSFNSAIVAVAQAGGGLIVKFTPCLWEVNVSQ